MGSFPINPGLDTVTLRPIWFGTLKDLPSRTRLEHKTKRVPKALMRDSNGQGLMTHGCFGFVPAFRLKEEFGCQNVLRTLSILYKYVGADQADNNSSSRAYLFFV